MYIVQLHIYYITMYRSGLGCLFVAFCLKSFVVYLSSSNSIKFNYHLHLHLFLLSLEGKSQ